MPKILIFYHDKVSQVVFKNPCGFVSHGLDVSLRDCVLIIDTTTFSKALKHIVLEFGVLFVNIFGNTYVTTFT